MKKSKLLPLGYKLIIGLISILMSIILVYYLINCSLNSFNYNFLLSLVLIMIFYFISYILLEKLLDKNEKVFKIVLVGCSIFIYTVWNLIVNTQPVSDYEVLINGAKQFIQGNFAKLSFDKTNYFYFFNFQTGYVIYLASVMKLLGTSLLGLKTVEILILSFSNLLVYLIARNIYNEKIGLIAALVYSTLLFNIAGSSVINNQHLNILLVLITIYLLTKSSKKMSNYLLMVISGTLLALSYIFRQSSLIFIIAICCFMILLLLSKNNEMKFNFKNMLVFIVTIGIVLFSYDNILKLAHVVPNSALAINAKYFKYVTGIYGHGITETYTTSAEKTYVYYDLKNFNFDYDKYNDACREFLKNRFVKERDETIDFISKRVAKFTAEPDNQIEGAVSTDFTNRNLYKLMVNYGYTQYIMIIFLAFTSVVFIKRENKNIKNKNLFSFWQIVFIGFFLCHLVIESQSRYRYDQYLALSILAAPTLYYLINFLNSKIKNFKYYAHRLFI